MSAKHITQEEFQNIFKTSKYVLVDFYADWCPPCKMMSPIIDRFSQDPELSQITFVKVNVDEERELSMQFGIQSIPTFILFRATENGNYEIVTKFIGGQEPITFKTKLIQATQNVVDV